MITTTIGEIINCTGGRLLQGDPETKAASVSTDSRKLQAGGLFFALAGENFDGHDFLGQAARAGACGLVVMKEAGYPPGIPVVLVSSTLEALQQVALHNREKCGEVAVVGVTGSTGKTTVKDILASILSAHLPVVKTEGNLNNEVGLPLTLTKLDHSCRVAVVEMAMRGPGEIDALCRIARPTAALITNIGETHLERLGSVSNIAAAKGEILDWVPETGFALLNADSPFTGREAKRCRGRVVYFGSSPGSDIYPLEVRTGAAGSWFTASVKGDLSSFYLPLPGRHNVINALGAIGAARELGLSAEQIAVGLARSALTGMRLEIIDCGGLTIINDAYNANPSSSKAALAVHLDVAGDRRRVAVLGNMFELGSRTEAGHREVGEQAAALKVDYLVSVGDLARGIAEGGAGSGMPPERIFCCVDKEEANRLLDGLLQQGDVVLVKGSRGMKMEQIVEHLKKRAGTLKGQKGEA